MNPATRRERLLNLLHRGSTTVPIVAESLRVSERTVYRDIAVLRESGHEIQATPGPGGGVRVTPDSRPRPVQFQVSEIVGLALSVAILKASPHLPFTASAEAALNRARRALSAERQRAMRRLEQRILIGRQASEFVRNNHGAVDDSVLTVFEQCFTQSRQMHFGYTDRHGAVTTRCIECVALVLNDPVWYIVAWDLDKDAPRTFRMDRISAPSRGPALVDTHDLDHVIDIACPGAEAAYADFIGTPIG